MEISGFIEFHCKNQNKRMGDLVRDIWTINLTCPIMRHNGLPKNSHKTVTPVNSTPVLSYYDDSQLPENKPISGFDSHFYLPENTVKHPDLTVN